MISEKDIIKAITHVNPGPIGKYINRIFYPQLILNKAQTNQVGKGVINSFINRLPYEMHLPGHNFTGPGTKLNERLNSDLTPKEWSTPINRVDESAYKHDVCYLQNKDTKTRNEVCDENMINELDSIENPNIRERLERGVVKPIIKAKKTFGMGISNVINTMYCLKCKKKTETVNPVETKSKNGKNMMKGNCVVCGSKKSVFLKN